MKKCLTFLFAALLFLISSDGLLRAAGASSGPPRDAGSFQGQATTTVAARWTLQDIVFDDGGSAAGSFILDAEHGEFLDIDISVSGGNLATFPPVTYNLANVVLANFDPEDGVRFVMEPGEQFLNGREIRLDTITALTNSGGIAVLELDSPFGAECYNCDPFRTFESGQLEGGSLVRPRGDFNLDSVVDGVDVALFVQELNDGDGESVDEVQGGTFRGTARFDLTEDGLITTADLTELGTLALGKPEDGVGRGLIPPIGGADTASVLDFPRLAFLPDRITGIAIVNPNNQDAPVDLVAYGADGQILAETSFAVGAGQQLPALTMDLFGNSFDADTVGWFQATSPVPDLTGFFLDLELSFLELDGADLPQRASDLVFNQIRIDGDFSTELNLVNPGSSAASLQLTLVGPAQPVIRPLNIPARGAARLDAQEFFFGNGAGAAGNELPAGSYVRVQSDREVLGFELIRSAGGDFQGLNARDALEFLSAVYIPQMAVLGVIESELGLVNYSNQSVLVTVSAHSPGGELFADEVQQNPVTLNLAARESLNRDVAELFGFQGESTIEGWLEIVSTSQAVNGFFAYRIPLTGAAATVAAIADDSRSAVFSHLATTRGFFTGVAALNPAAYPVNLRIVALATTGLVLGAHDRVLQPRERFAELITNLIPGSEEQNGGFILMLSNYPLYFTSLFGNDTTTVLANIPPQDSPPSFRPDAGIPQARILPAGAAVAPSDSRQFQVQGATGNVVWSVNGVPGGNGEFGTVSQSGLYQAPAGQPSPLPVTVAVEGNGQAASVWVDVLQSQTFMDGFGTVQSVSFLEGLQRLYTAEVAGLAGAGISGQSPAGGLASAVFEVTPQDREMLVEFAGDELTKMVPFEARDGNEYLILAARTSGRILRLNPQTRAVREIAVQNQPAALAFDLLTDDLLVAEPDQIVSIPRSRLESDLSPAQEGAALQEAGGANRGKPLQGFDIQPDGVDGLAVDECTGTVYFSQKEAGTVMAFDRRAGALTELVSGLGRPGQLLTAYRAGLSCPDSFSLLIVEESENLISLAVPSLDLFLSPYLPAQDPTDLILVPPDSGLLDESAVLFEQQSSAGGQGVSQLSVVDTSAILDRAAINPPLLLTPGRATSSPGPDLAISTLSATAESNVAVDIFYRPGPMDRPVGGPDETSVLLFTVDYDQTRLAFDGGDLNRDGVPDGIRVDVPEDYLVVVRYDPAQTGGELGFLVVDAFAPLQTVPEQVLFRLEFTTRASAAGTAFVNLTAPGPQAVDVLAQEQEFDELVNGLVSIAP